MEFWCHLKIVFCLKFGFGNSSNWAFNIFFVFLFCISSIRLPFLSETSISQGMSPTVFMTVSSFTVLYPLHFFLIKGKHAFQLWLIKRGYALLMRNNMLNELALFSDLMFIPLHNHSSKFLEGMGRIRKQEKINSTWTFDGTWLQRWRLKSKIIVSKFKTEMIYNICFGMSSVPGITNAPINHLISIYPLGFPLDFKEVLSLSFQLLQAWTVPASHSNPSHSVSLWSAGDSARSTGKWNNEWIQFDNSTYRMGYG